MTRAVVIVNPAAGGGRTGRLWPSLRDDLVRLGLTFDVALTAGPGDAIARRVESPAALPTHLDGEVTADTPVAVSVCAGVLRLRA